jgi:hypothetical protein
MFHYIFVIIHCALVIFMEFIKKENNEFLSIKHGAFIILMLVVFIAADYVIDVDNIYYFSLLALLVFLFLNYVYAIYLYNNTNVLFPGHNVNDNDIYYAHRVSIYDMLAFSVICTYNKVYLMSIRRFFGCC